MKNMILLGGLALLMVGCATTAQPDPMLSQLQMRVGELERTVQAKDQQISDLEYTVKDLDVEVKRLRQQPARAAVSTSSRSSSSAAGDDGPIIRVDASAEQVQTALKNAGYYTGNIDGKVGAGTKQAIMQFQKDRNLKADGLVGRQTWAELQTFLQ